MSPPATPPAAHGLGALVFVGYVMALVWTAPDLAMSRDESFYVHAARDYGAWWVELVSEDPGRALTQTRIDQAWDYNWEHPPLMKLAFAGSSLIHRAFDAFSTESNAFRFPTMVTAGLLLWLVLVWGASVAGLRAGLFSALSLGLFPRVFYHAHLAAFDVPIGFFVTLTAYAYWRALSDRRWAPLVGLAFGCALATKHNSWILPAVLLVHYLWFRWGRATSEGDPKPSLSWLGWMLVLGPLLLFALWPWLWADPWPRLAAYVRFHLDHVHYTYSYFGRSYFEPPLPVSVPFVMTALTVPAIFVVLALGGVVQRRAAFAPPWVAPVRDGGRRVEVLWLGLALAPMLAIALPSTPIFGGTKHWLTAYPFIALFAGCGFDAAASVVERAVFPRRWPVPLLGVLCLLPGLVQTEHSHPFGLSHYTPLAGGVPGAADLGMNRQFWGFTTGSLAGWIREELPEGGRVWTGDTTWGAWAMMQVDGLLPSDIVPARDLADADLVLVHHEPHFAEVDYQAWMVLGHVRPAVVLTYDGVPLISAYRR